MPKKKNRASIKDKGVEFNKKLIDEMLRLATSGFGLVAALSWNNLIQSAIKQYIEPIIGKGSGIISLFIYAVAVTTLAVVVTYNLTKIKNRL